MGRVGGVCGEDGGVCRRYVRGDGWCVWEDGGVCRRYVRGGWVGGV